MVRKTLYKEFQTDRIAGFNDKNAHRGNNEAQVATNSSLAEAAVELIHPALVCMVPCWVRNVVAVAVKHLYASHKEPGLWIPKSPNASACNFKNFLAFLVNGDGDWTTVK